MSLHQNELIDVFENLVGVVEVLVLVEVASDEFVELALDDWVEDALDALAVVLDVVVCHAHSLVWVAEADEHVDVLYVAANGDEVDDAWVADALEHAAPEGEGPVGDALQMGDVALRYGFALVDVGDAHLDVGECLGHDVLAKEDGVVLGIVELGYEALRVLLVVEHAELELVGCGVVVARVELAPELLVVVFVAVDHLVVALTEEMERHVYSLLVSSQPEEAVCLHGRYCCVCSHILFMFNG